LCLAEKVFRDGIKEAKDRKKSIKKEHSKQAKAVERLEKAKSKYDQQLAELRAQQKWHCVQMRNTHITEAIKRDFAQRQEKLARDMGHNSAYDGSVDVIPVSATAFRHHLKGREGSKEIEGFPTPFHTGIPRLRQWLEDSTLERREEHLDALLNSLLRLFLMIQAWSDRICGHHAVRFSREAVQEFLFRTHDKYFKVRPTPQTCVWSIGRLIPC
jgi:hypothetical protein